MSADPIAKCPAESEIVDLAGLDAVFGDAAGHLNAQHGRLVANAVWMLDNERAWQGDGVWTPAAYIRWRAGVSDSTAAKIAKVAERAGDFPDCVAALQRGVLSLDQISPIVRHAPGWVDREIAAVAPMWTVAQISKVARQYDWDLNTPTTPEPGDPEPEAGDEADDIDDQPSAQPDPSVEPDQGWFGWDDDGRFRLFVNTGPDAGLIIETALRESHDSLFDSGHPDVTTVDAVVEMANRSLDTVESPARRNRYRVNLFIDDTDHAQDGRGRPLPDTVADRICCDATITPIVIHDGIPVSVGRSQHIVPDRTRRIVEHRDGGCRVPGCGHDRYVEVHHIVHWNSGGRTDTPNLICLCAAHHRLHHQGKLGIEGDADTKNGITFTDADGRDLAESGARPKPPGAPPPPIEGTYQHPIGGRLDTRSLYFNDDPNRPPPAWPPPTKPSTN